MQRETQKDKVLRYLKKYGSITTWESFMEHGDTRLSDKIYRLKKEGYEFDEEWVTRKNRDGYPVTFKKYILKIKED